MPSWSVTALYVFGPRPRSLYWKKARRRPPSVQTACWPATAPMIVTVYFVAVAGTSFGRSGTFAACAASSSAGRSMISGLAPGFLRPKRREDGARRGAAVQRVEMDAGRAVAQQIRALQRGPGDAELERGLGIVAPGAERRGEARRELRAAERGEALDLIDVRDRHDAREDGNGD